VKNLTLQDVHRILHARGLRFVRVVREGKSRRYAAEAADVRTGAITRATGITLESAVENLVLGTSGRRRWATA